MTGTVTGTGSDSYTFSVAQGTSFIISVGETGVHDPKFVPMIGLVDPNGLERGHASPFNSKIQEDTPAAGPWTVKVSRGDDGGTSGGNYSLTLVQAPVSTGATQLTAGSATPGSNTRGDVQLWTFTGTAGQSEKLTFNATNSHGFIADTSIFAPSGLIIGGGPCAATCEGNIAVTQNGTYTIAVSRQDSSDVTGNYTISVSNQN